MPGTTLTVVMQPAQHEADLAAIMCLCRQCTTAVKRDTPEQNCTACHGLVVTDSILLVMSCLVAQRKGCWCMK